MTDAPHASGRPRRILAAGLAALALMLLATGLGAFRGADRDALDAAFDVRGARPASDVVVVGIDSRTLTGTGVTWPFPRRLHAQMIRRLHAAAVRSLVYDIQFTEPSPSAADDEALIDAVASAPGTVLVTAETAKDGSTQILGGDATVREAQAVAASAALPEGTNGVARTYARTDGTGKVPSVATAVARQLGRTVPRGRFNAQGNALIDYRGPARTFPTYSFRDVMSGRVPASKLRGKIVIVGATAPGLLDFESTSAPGTRQLPGSEILANAIWTALRGNPLQPAAPWVQFGLAILLSLATLLALLRLRLDRAVAFGLALVVLAVGGAYLAFTAGAVVPIVGPALTTLAVLLAGSLSVVAANVAQRLYLRRYGEQLEREVEARTAALEASQLEVVLRLARAAELRDDDTGEHIDRMSDLCGEVARELGMPEAEATKLSHAAALHDIGKIGVPDAVLLKPGKLTPEEFDVMRTHVVNGATLLTESSSPILVLAEEVARTHHEKWDGSGYPAGLAGEDIPLSGRIAAVCDVFDALTNVRPYKRAWSIEEATAEIARGKGSHFDPAVADALLAVIARR